MPIDLFLCVCFISKSAAAAMVTKYIATKIWERHILWKEIISKNKNFAIFYTNKYEHFRNHSKLEKIAIIEYIYEEGVLKEKEKNKLIKAISEMK